MSPNKRPRAQTKTSAITIIFVAYTIACVSVASALTQSITFPNALNISYTSSYTIAVQVGASNDDAGAWWDWAGYYWPWTLDKSHVSVGGFTYGSKYNGGLRFSNVNIPQGAKIVSAVLKVCSDQTCDGTRARWNIYGQNAGDCNQFSTPEDFLARPKTAAKVDTGFWTRWIEGQWYQTNISAIIHEIVNRPDWQPSNSLALLLFGHDEAGTTHEIRSYDANPNQAAIIEVTFETVG